MKANIMGLLKKLVLLSGAGAVMLAVLLYRPMPEGICTPVATVRVLDAGFRLAVAAGKLLWRLQLTDHPYWLMRNLMDGAGRLADAACCDGVQARDDTFAGVRVRTYVPAETGGAGARRPFVVYFHGGGWVIGNVELWNGYLSKVARDTGAVVVAVDYRLAPEHPFPAPLDDALAVTRYLLGNGAALGLDVRRAAVMGDSAGGNLAAAVAAQLGGSASGLKAQVLIYPVVGGPYSFHFKSFQFESQVLLTAEHMAIFYLSYAGGQRHFQHIDQLVAGNFSWDPVPPKAKKFLAKYRHSKDAGRNPGIRAELDDTVLFDERVAPLLADDLSGVPQAFVATCEYDVLRDEGLAYVDRLNDAGVFVDHYHSPDGFHSMHMDVDPKTGPVFESAVKMYDATVKFIKSRL